MKNLISKAKLNIATATGSLFYGATSVMAQSGFLNPTDNPSAIAGQTGGESSLRNLILTIVNYFLGFLGLIAVIMVIYGGVLMVTSGGSDEGFNKGKKILTYAAIGIVIILLSFAFVSTIFGAGSGQQG